MDPIHFFWAQRFGVPAMPRMWLDAVRSKCHTICCDQQHAVAVQSATSPAVITMLLLLLLLLLLWEEGGDGVKTTKGMRAACQRR